MLHESHIDSYSVGDFWIVQGRDRDLVIDTGCGMVDPVPLVEAICAKPIIALALNSSYDHAGGWHGFAERACHPLDAPALETLNNDDAEVDVYLTEDRLWALPFEGFTLHDYRLTPASPTLLVEEGYQFDLGNRQLEVMHVPGRSPGGLAVWEQSTGSLFTSDMLYDGDHGLAWPPSQPQEYCSSLRRFRKLPVNQVYCGHYGAIDRARMLEVIDSQIEQLERTS